MAIGDPYTTLAGIKPYLAMQEDDRYDDALEDAVDSVSREIEGHCNRQFNKQTGATARIFVADSATYVKIDDFWTTTGLVIESGLAYGTVWTAADYDLYPLNGVVDGVTGWPYYKIRVSDFGGLRFVRGQKIRVTAQWGWNAVPTPVVQACKILAAATFQIKDSPFGVAGSDQWGSIRVKDNPMALKKLSRFVQDPILVG
jgi:hypothetical protein